jgi:CBS domain-containing protein
VRGLATTADESGTVVRLAARRHLLFEPAERTMMLVQDLMHAPVISVGESEELEGVEELLRTQRVRHLPVTRGHELVGLVSHRDYLIAHQRSLHQSDAIWTSEFMKREVVTIRADAPASEAARIMLERKIGCLPVVSREGTLIGIITDSDFLRFAKEHFEREARDVHEARGIYGEPA